MNFSLKYKVISIGFSRYLTRTWWLTRWTTKIMFKYTIIHEMTYKLKLAHTTANMNQFPSNATQPEKVLICHTILSVTQYPVRRVRFVKYLTLIFAFLFAVVISEACFFAVNGSTGFISSSETKNYDDCTWIVTAPSNHTVKLKFKIFRLSHRAIFQIHDEKNENDTVLGLLSGARQPFVIQTSGRLMMLAVKKKDRSTSCDFEGTYYTSLRKG